MCAAEVKAAHNNEVINIVECNHDPLCHGYRWQIADDDKLSQLVAWTMQGHYRHAEHILKALHPTSITGHPTIQQQAIDRLTLPLGTENVTIRWHRDGLVFQHIAWIAAIIKGESGIAATMPHLIPAHKGFDALLVPLDKDGNALSGIIICEEKATTNPRSEITQKVWPSIKEVETGDRDAELNGELTSVLRSCGVKNIDQIITEAHWLNHKAYRVSITISPDQDSDKTRSKLFVGYDVTAPGGLHRRRAETLAVSDLRTWMDIFCARVIVAIQGAK